MPRSPMSPATSLPESAAESEDVAIEGKPVSVVSASAHATIETSRSEEGVRVGAILDEFSHACFDPECNLLTFRPDNWRQTLEKEKVDLLLVESAWHGNDDAWQYRVASYKKNMGDELSDLLSWCKTEGIPTVFWNKEDPAHYDRFIDSARKFDVVVTTDANCLDRYREQVGHQRVFAMPFAAQPAIHSPVLTHPRRGKVCFAGTYYGDRLEQRREDMDCILGPSLEFGLDIYDRMHGVVGPGTEQYRFPDIYRGAIRGRLEYQQMVEAYKDYRVFLNVNSVKNSPTMFSRRVFELLACGTPVVSTASVGIRAVLGDNIVRFVGSEQETAATLTELLEDEGAWARVSALGIRKVMGEHTYSHRFRYLCECAGLGASDPDLPTVWVIARCANEAELQRLSQGLTKQTYSPLGLLVINPDGLKEESLVETESRLKGAHIEFATIARNAILPYLRRLGDETILSFVSCRDVYGPEYIADAVQALNYSGKDVVGKAAFFSANGSSSEVELISVDLEHHIVTEVRSATVTARKKALTDRNIAEVLDKELIDLGAARIYAGNRFNYLHLSNECVPESIPQSVIDRVVV